MSDSCGLNTDHELYREPKGDLPSDYYAPSVHVTQDGRIGMSAGGAVITLTIREWVGRAFAARVETFTPAGTSADECQCAAFSASECACGDYRDPDIRAKVLSRTCRGCGTPLDEHPDGPPCSPPPPPGRSVA